MKWQKKGKVKLSKIRAHHQRGGKPTEYIRRRPKCFTQTTESAIYVSVFNEPLLDIT